MATVDDKLAILDILMTCCAIAGYESIASTRDQFRLDRRCPDHYIDR
jgi:hypothetical protein